MNISPVSFGKTIKVHTTRDEAQYIAEMANKKFFPQDKVLSEEAKEIFDDVLFLDPNTNATVYNVDGDTYILSGKDASFVKFCRQGSESDTTFMAKLKMHIQYTKSPYELFYPYDENGERHLARVNVLDEEI